MSSFSRNPSFLKKILAPGLVFGIALVLRFLHLYCILPILQAEQYLTDGRYFDALVRALVSGNYDGQTPIVCLSPVYTGFLYIFYGLTDYPLLLARGMQIFVSAISCLGLQQIGKGLFGERAGWAAGLMGAFCGVWIYFDVLLIKASLTTSLLILMLWAIYRGARGGSLVWWGFAGAACALLCMLRMQFLMVLPWIIWKIFQDRYWMTLRQRVWVTVVFVLFAACLPFFIRVWFESVVQRTQGLPAAHEIASAQGGIHFYLGNHESANGTYKRVDGIRASAVGHIVDARKIAQEEEAREITAQEVDRFWGKRAMRIISENPQRWLMLEVKKIFLIFNSYEIPNGYNYDYWRERSFVLSFPLVSYGWVLPLAVIGWIKLRHESRMMVSLLKGIAVFYAMALMVTFVTSEYRLPLYPGFILFAAFAVDQILIQWRRREYKQLFRIGCLWIFLVFVCHYPTYLDVERYNALTQARYDKLVSNQKTFNQFEEK